MIHRHNFIKVSELTKPRTTQVSVMAGIPGAEVVCWGCGQVRKIYADGEVKIVVEGNKPIDEDDISNVTKPS